MKPLTHCAHCLCGLVLAASAGLGLTAHAAPVLSIVPEAGSALVGQTFRLTVGISDINDLYAYNLSLQYDASVVRFIALSEGSFMRSVHPTFFVSGGDNGAGRVNYSGASLIGGYAGVSGSGTLIEFLFEGSGGGNAAFSFADLRFLDAALADIVVLADDASVTVTQVPEPSGIALSLGAALALLLTRAGMLVRIKKAARGGAALTAGAGRRT